MSRNEFRRFWKGVHNLTAQFEQLAAEAERFMRLAAKAAVYGFMLAYRRLIRLAQHAEQSALGYLESAYILQAQHM